MLPTTEFTAHAMTTVPHDSLPPGQCIDFQRVASFAGAWKENPSLTRPNRAMAEDLAWLASHIQQADSAEASDGSAAREMACHLCRLLAENKLPPCRSEGCALHGVE